MFKKCFFTFCLVVYACQLFATHVDGGELRYEFNGVNYTVTLKVQTNCTGAVLPSTQNLTFVSSFCLDSFQRTFSATSVDTIKGIWCPSFSITCVTPVTPVIIYTYSDTVTIGQCSDWRMYRSLSALGSSLDNIGPNPGSQSLYLEAKLNNSNGVNSSPYIANHPPFQIDNNTIHTSPLQAVDADGDSIVLKFKQIPTGPNTTTPFAPPAGLNPYSVNHQMGNFTTLDNVNQKLVLNSSFQSENIMAIGIEEYRNGQLIGEYTRAWTTTVRNYANYTTPMAVSGTNFSYVTLWGQFNSITINFEDSTVTDSVFVDFFPPTLNGFTFSTSISNGLGVASGTIMWSTPSGVSESELPYFIIPVRVKNNTCPDQSYAYYGILVDMQQAFPLSLMDISATNAGSRNRLDWNLETNNSDFEIERSIDGKKFVYLATAPGSKNDNTYWDEQPVAGTNYYRLKLHDAKGSIYYSNVVSAVVNENDAPLNLNAYPNPVSGMLSIKIAGNLSGNATLSVYDITGKLLLIKHVTDNKPDVDMRTVSPGIYFIKYSDSQHNETMKVIKQ